MPVYACPVSGLSQVTEGQRLQPSPTQRRTPQNSRRSFSSHHQKPFLRTRTVSCPRRRETPPLTHSHTPPVDERASFHGHSDDDGGEE
ncbi:hypothetical protein BGW80DRAFT_366907 [Lactifluus volemus]|nr:hypothetical protein BGW80DRAFT_366907 [Lactifluus volemus]